MWYVLLACSLVPSAKNEKITAKFLLTPAEVFACPGTPKSAKNTDDTEVWRKKERLIEREKSENYTDENAISQRDRAGSTTSDAPPPPGTRRVCPRRSLVAALPSREKGIRSEYLPHPFRPPLAGPLPSMAEAPRAPAPRPLAGCSSGRCAALGPASRPLPPEGSGAAAASRPMQRAEAPFKFRRVERLARRLREARGDQGAHCRPLDPC